jgi:hypothetical protein
MVTIEIFKQSISELDDEITALSTIKSILKFLVDEMQEKVNVSIHHDFLSDTSMLSLVESLSFTKYKIKENLSMEGLNKANATLNILTDKKEQEKIRHPQEKIVEMLNYKGITVDIVEWIDTIWCGKIGYAANNTDEPDVDKIMSDFQALNFPAAAADRLENNWDVCLSANYLSKKRPHGVMFGSLVAADRQLDGFDIYKVPATKYARIRMCDETAKALGHEPWKGGIPPHEWIGKEIAPKIGYRYGNDTLPIFEYYGYYDPEKYAHEFCYLYVPIRKA